jgi:hypothetical protein
VALTSVLAHASIAAHNGQFTMTLDHKSAYLNATMSGPRVGMNLTSDVVDILPTMDESYAQWNNDSFVEESFIWVFAVSCLMV